MPEKNVPVTLVLDFVKQKQEWGLRFRDSSHSDGEMREQCFTKSLREPTKRQVFALL